MHNNQQVKDRLNEEIINRFGNNANIKKILSDCETKFHMIDNANLLNLIDLYDEYYMFLKNKIHRDMLTKMIECIKIDIDNYMYNAKSEFESVVSTGSIKAYELIKFRLTNEVAFENIKNLIHIEKIRRECESIN